MELLVDGRHSLVVETSSGEVLAFDGRGIGDLYRLYMSVRRELKGARVADKVIGAGAAALMIEGGVSVYHAGVISRKALELFDRCGIVGTYDVLAEQIINRAGTGRCPLEKIVAHLDETVLMLPLIHKFVSENSTPKIQD